MNAEIENAAKFLGSKVLLRKLPSPEQLLVKDDLVGVQSQQPDHRTGIPQIEHIKMILVPEMNSYRFQEP